MTSIITPEKYLTRKKIQVHLEGLCHVFFNKTYIKYFEDYELKPVFTLNTINIYSIHLKTNAYVAIIRNAASLSSIDFECLIHIGFSDFIFYGFACSISNCNIGDIVLVKKAYIGEGVSQHYNKNTIYNLTSEQLNSQLINKLDSQFIVNVLNCYSTDALFMETGDLLEELKKYEIGCIDMECSALTSISDYRKVNVAFIFCISDMIKGDSWIYKNDIDLRKRLVDALLLVCC